MVTLFCSLFQPARRRAERRQRPQRHTVAADVRITSEAASTAAIAASIQREESLNRPQNQQISRWYSTNKINSYGGRRDSNSDLTPTAPSTPVPFYEEADKRPSLLPSAASVVRALSPLLTPAFMAANNMAQKAAAAKKEVKSEDIEVVQPPPQPMEAKDVPIMSQVNNRILSKIGIRLFIAGVSQKILDFIGAIRPDIGYWSHFYFNRFLMTRKLEK